MEKVAIAGAGSWATALAVLLSKKVQKVELWARRPELAGEINSAENVRYLPGVPIPENVRAKVDLESVLAGAEAVIFAVPSHAFREVLRRALPCLPRGILLVNAAKGLEENTFLRMSEVFLEEGGPVRARFYVVLSGPSHAEEVGRGMPTAVVCAGFSPEAAGTAQDLLMTESFRVYTSSDVKGVELGGALKNIIALGTGIADGLGFGDNTKAALMTRGLAEITRLGCAMGADPRTFAGLAGVGDLIVTCTSMHSRNRRAGMEIGKGKSLEEALAAVKMVVEGVRTTRAARQLALLRRIEMPITEQIYQVLFAGLSPRTAVVNLMTRDRRSELEHSPLPF
ncbi:MAG: NAD(P)H-dependent glycerol-3-phosphate dehydrogenase [Armatimonadetes bacterium]|nr:NAD(P)H-dependent glycerol-3-phosphate dehydrogenase [Armatimonadota bacterium]